MASSLGVLNGERRGKDIFISYGREEGVKSFVQKLKADLEAANLSVWLDVDIPAGSEWPKEIGLALQDCKALIAVVTKKYISSQYCKKELYVACGNHKDIFPIIYEDGWEKGDEGAGVRYMISSCNWTFFRPASDDYRASLQKLIGGLKGTRPAIAPLQSPETSLSRSVVDRGSLGSGSDGPCSPGSDVPDTPTLSSFHLRRLADKPKLFELQSLKCRDGTKIEIIDSIAPVWTRFGILLDFDDVGKKLDVIDATHKTPVACCTEMFKKWITGAGRQPASWNVVVELLEDIDHKTLAEEVKAALQD